MILGLTGFARVGKDSVANILVEKYGFTKLSFAEPMREMLYALNPFLFNGMRVLDAINQHGYEKTKDLFPEFRQLLQRMGSEAGRKVLGDDIWIKTLFRKVDELETDVVISDVRITQEAIATNAKGGAVVQITRPDIVGVNTHVTEAGVDQKYIRYTLGLPSKKDSPIEKLPEAVETMMRYLRCHK